MSTFTDSRVSRQEEETLANALRASRVVELAMTAAVGVAVWAFVDGGESTMPQEQILALQGGTMLLMLVAGWMVFAGAAVSVFTGSPLPPVAGPAPGRWA